MDQNIDKKKLDDEQLDRISGGTADNSDPKHWEEDVANKWERFGIS